MSFFGFKISNPKSKELVDSIKSGSRDFIIEQLNQLETELKYGASVFIVLGGDKVSWDKGLIGLAEIIEEPFDKGYDAANPRNFRLRLRMRLVLSDVMKRTEFIPYIDAYDAAGIGPNTKGEQNQAIKSLEKRQAAQLYGQWQINSRIWKMTSAVCLMRPFRMKFLAREQFFVSTGYFFGEKYLPVSKNYSAGFNGDNILIYGVPGSGKSRIFRIKTYSF